MGPWLFAGPTEISCKWALHISTRTKETIPLLEFLSQLKLENNFSFRVIKDQYANYNLNAGNYGYSETGKVVSIYLKSENEIQHFCKLLEPLTSKFSGPVVPGTKCIGRNLYLTNNPPEGHSASKAKKKKNPRIIGSCNVITEIIRNAPKGAIYKGICFKNFNFRECVIKQGLQNVLEDFLDRDIRTRLEWQARVLNDLKGKANVPEVFGYYENNGDGYLVTEFLEGELLTEKINGIYRTSAWNRLPLQFKVKVLDVFLKILHEIQKIHRHGYVHRDIQDNNILVKRDGSIYILDFELSYSLKDKEPRMPFAIGTIGYMSKEQMYGAVPAAEEDIYSLGCLFCFCISGIHPREFVREKLSETLRVLKNYNLGGEIFSAIGSCLDKDPRRRISIERLIDAVSAYKDEIQSEKLSIQNKPAIAI